jgi:hypothetical protein
LRWIRCWSRSTHIIQINNNVLRLNPVPRLDYSDREKNRARAMLQTTSLLVQFTEKRLIGAIRPKNLRSKDIPLEFECPGDGWTCIYSSSISMISPQAC